MGNTELNHFMLEIIAVNSYQYLIVFIFVVFIILYNYYVNIY